MSLVAAKTAARNAARARRAAAHGVVDPAPALAALCEVLAPFAGQVVAGYSAIGTEIDPAPALAALAQTHQVCLPVTHGHGRGLTFHLWTPGAALQAAGFGTVAPVDAPRVRPDVVIVPLLAFDRLGGRMGYGAGHYDRTLEALRADGPLRAYGFAYGAQEDPGMLPQEPTDQPLDGIVTEVGLLVSGS